MRAALAKGMAQTRGWYDVTSRAAFHLIVKILRSQPQRYSHAGPARWYFKQVPLAALRYLEHCPAVFTQVASMEAVRVADVQDPDNIRALLQAFGGEDLRAGLQAEEAKAALRLAPRRSAWRTDVGISTASDSSTQLLQRPHKQ